MSSTNSMTAAGVPRLLKPHEAADVLSISERTLWKLTKAGEIPGVRIGTQWRYDRDDLLTWINSRKSGQPPGAAT